MSALGDILDLGLGVLRGVAGAVTGTLDQDDVTTAWTEGRIVTELREPAEGNKDRLERVLELAAPVTYEVEADDPDDDPTVVTVTPRADANVVFTGSTTRWRAMSADPITPGGTTIAWRLRLEAFVVRDASI